MLFKILVLSAFSCLYSAAYAAPTGEYSNSPTGNYHNTPTENYSNTRGFSNTPTEGYPTSPGNGMLFDKVRQTFDGQSDLDGLRNAVGTFVPLNPAGNAIASTGIPNGKGTDLIGGNDFDLGIVLSAAQTASDIGAKTLKGYGGSNNYRYPGSSANQVHP